MNTKQTAAKKAFKAKVLAAFKSDDYLRKVLKLAHRECEKIKF